VEELMAGGANPAAATEGGRGSEYEFNFWNSISAGFVPVLYGVLAIIAWYRSPTAPGIAQIELYSGIVLIAVGVAAQAGWFKITARQDFFGGLGLIALALFALWASRDLPGMRGFAFGPGTAPRMFSIMLGLMGVVVALTGVFTKGPPVGRFGIRGPVFILASVYIFAFGIRPLGLVITSFLSIFVSAFATSEVRWLESMIWAAVLTLFCSLLFPWGLNLPLPLWPTIDIARTLGMR
jgi:putative tricarboxylic transport membrane protein